MSTKREFAWSLVLALSFVAVASSSFAGTKGAPNPKFSNSPPLPPAWMALHPKEVHADGLLRADHYFMANGGTVLISNGGLVVHPNVGPPLVYLRSQIRSVYREMRTNPLGVAPAIWDNGTLIFFSRVGWRSISPDHRLTKEDLKNVHVVILPQPAALLSDGSVFFMPSDEKGDIGDLFSSQQVWSLSTSTEVIRMLQDLKGTLSQ